jgi:3-methyladenine DNA glycosylase AlkD
MNVDEVLARLETLARPEAVAGMAHYGITGNKIYGAAIPDLRQLAREIGKDGELAQALWQVDSRETRILASLIYPPKEFTETLMDHWVTGFDSWEVCDQCCANLFEKLPVAYAKCVEWSRRDEEFVKRAGFVLMARLAVSDKRAEDARFETFLPIIEQAGDDSRNFVKKAVNWALRGIGKRNLALNRKAIAVAEAMRQQKSGAARWIGSDALRELAGEAVQARLAQKETAAK